MGDLAESIVDSVESINIPDVSNAPDISDINVDNVLLLMMIYPFSQRQSSQLLAVTLLIKYFQSRIINLKEERHE